MGCLGWNQRRRRRRWTGEEGVYMIYFRLPLLLSLNSRPLEKLRGPSGSVTPGGHWVTGQYGASLALTAAKRQIDGVCECGIIVAKAKHSKPKLSWKRVWARLIIFHPPGPETNLSRFQHHQVFPLSRWQNGSGQCLRSCNENSLF